MSESPSLVSSRDELLALEGKKKKDLRAMARKLGVCNGDLDRAGDAADETAELINLIVTANRGPDRERKAMSQGTRSDVHGGGHRANLSVRQ